MKQILLISISILLFGCEKYEQPTSLSLSGTYIINEIIIDSEYNTLDTILSPGDLFVNNNGGSLTDTVWTPLGPIDTIIIGQSKWAFDYMKIYTNPYVTDTRIIWNNIYYYQTYLQSRYDYGYFEFYCENGVRLFKIEEDGLEILVFNTIGNQLYYGENKITITLIRVGP